MAKIFKEQLSTPFPTDTVNFAIEKINNRIKKDVRTATFGVMEYMNSADQDIGRLRSKAMSQARRDAFEARKLAQSGDSGTYPNVPALNQRDVRQMTTKPGITPKPESFK